MIRMVFHWPTGFASLFDGGSTSYNAARVRFPFFPSFASACLASSISWYSQPREVFLNSEYLIPLFVPGSSLNSSESSKSPNSLLVTMSPPCPELVSVLRTPSLTTHPLPLKGCPFAFCHPSNDFPSNNNTHPS